MPSSAATCVNGRPLPASSATASRLNSSVNVRRVLLVIRSPRSLRSLSEVSTQPGEGQTEVTQKLDEEERVPVNRYFDGSPVYPGR